ncbi:MAG: dihydrofolate reductase [Alistipes sp.]|nr:dihydrofolate reductase [Alistipes sp.]MBR2111195.1 dihydrofolate reductase [Alistipes sp.]MBR6632093.1 dihydrofolate reductase [Alistipes sp.]
MVSIIVAIAQNGTIGDKNSLLWHIKEDMRFFRTTTSGHAVVMGRKTFESLGSRPLPKRTNIVITRADRAFEGALTAHSLEEAIRLAEGDEEIFIIGGAQIYREALRIADRMYITRVMHDYEGDTSFPDIDLSEWELVAEEKHDRGEEYEYPFAFLTYERK